MFALLHHNSLELQRINTFTAQLTFLIEQKKNICDQYITALQLFQSARTCYICDTAPVHVQIFPFERDNRQKARMHQPKRTKFMILCGIKHMISSKATMS